MATVEWSLHSKDEDNVHLEILSALMSHPAFNKDRTLLEQIHGLQRLSDAYQKASGSMVADDLMLTTFVRCLPKQIQNHVQLSMTESTTFEEVKDKVLAFERLRAKERVYSELGMVTSYSNDSGGPAPMEINCVAKLGAALSPYHLLPFWFLVMIFLKSGEK